MTQSCLASALPWGILLAPLQAQGHRGGPLASAPSSPRARIPSIVSPLQGLPQELPEHRTDPTLTSYAARPRFHGAPLKLQTRPLPKRVPSDACAP